MYLLKVKSVSQGQFWNLLVLTISKHPRAFDAQHPHPTPLQIFPFFELYRHRVVTDELSHLSKCIDIEYSKEFEKICHIEWILLNVVVKHIPD